MYKVVRDILTAITPYNITGDIYDYSICDIIKKVLDENNLNYTTEYEHINATDGIFTFTAGGYSYGYHCRKELAQ